MPRFPHPSVRLALKPRGSALPVAPPNEVASCPAPCIFRLCRRPSFRLPRLPCPSALPSVKLRLPRTSLIRSHLLKRPPGRPGFCVFRPCRRWIFELPRISHPSALPALVPWSFPRSFALPVAPANALRRFPRFLHLPALPATDPRVAPRLESFGAPGAGALGFPSASRFQLRLPVRLRIAPPLSPSGFASGPIPQVAPRSRSLGAG